MPTLSQHIGRRLDRIGIGISGLCVVHCVFLPVAMGLVPFIAVAAWMHVWLHAAFAVMVIPTTILAMWLGYRRHRSLAVVGLMVLGMAAVVTALFVGHSDHGLAGETAVTLAGSSMLILGHWRNWKCGGACQLHRDIHTVNETCDAEA